MSTEEPATSRSPRRYLPAIPAIRAIRTYDRSWLPSDALAGLTVWALLVPQALAYAQLGGFDPVIGLYASIGALLGYALMGGVREMSVGPEATIALLTASIIAPLAEGDPSRYLALGAGVALMAGIRAAVPGAAIGDISGAVEDVATAGGYGIVRQYVGHGIGTSMHEDPQVPNFRSRHKGIVLRPGHCLAIEPMLTLGSEATELGDDRWTVSTWDGSLAAHFEHTIAVTAEGPEILTRV